MYEICFSCKYCGIDKIVGYPCLDCSDGSHFIQEQEDKMAEFIEEKEQAVNKGDPVIFENKTESTYDVSAGIVFHKSGIYEVTIAENRTVVAKVMGKPEIIHCKDCKHCEHWYADRGRCFFWHEDGISVFEDGFCNYAERSDKDG